MQPLTAQDPARIGPYALTHRLGAGGMGRVYLGSSQSGRLVAVKVVHPQFANDPAFRARFRREVYNARAVTGFYTAPVVDSDPDAEQPWLATAYISGPSLQQAVAERGPMPPASLRALAAGLAEALAAIHAAGVIHRDLKPSNVLLADDGPRVIDFGISRAAEASSLTQTRTTVGSAGYMAPEQVRSAQVGPEADVFALGATLVFAAGGRGPFEGPDGPGPAEAMLYRVVHEEPDLTGVPADLRDLISGCLAKDPTARPTPHGVLAGLSADAATRVLPGAEPPRTLVYREPATRAALDTPPTQTAATRPGSRRRLGFASAAAAVLLLCAGLAWTFVHGTGNAAAGPRGPVDSSPAHASASPSARIAQAAGEVRPSASSTPTATKVLTYEPWTSGGISAAVTVEQSTTGSCFDLSSSAITRADAYRCFQANTILDPCFADSFQDPVQEVACPTSPGKVVVIRLTQSLPDFSPPAQATLEPWLIVLPGAIQCTFTSGTAVMVGSQRVNYGCSGGGSLLGDPNVSGPTWTIDYQAPGSSAYSQTAIVAAYE